MELKYSKFRLILGIVFFSIMYIAYTLIDSKEILYGYIGIGLIPISVWGLIWIDHKFPLNK